MQTTQQTTTGSSTVQQVPPLQVITRLTGRTDAQGFHLIADALRDCTKSATGEVTVWRGVNGTSVTVTQDVTGYQVTYQATVTNVPKMFAVAAAVCNHQEDTFSIENIDRSLRMELLKLHKKAQAAGRKGTARSFFTALSLL